jgi:hypothetical protein
MERLLPCLAITIAFLAALGSASAEAAPAAIVASRCEPDGGADKPLTEPEIALCRQLWRDRVELSRLRADAARREMIETERRLRERGAVAKPPPVEIGTFLGDDGLVFGDVVVLENGPRVFIGKPGEPVTQADFVALDSPRSPHRKGVQAYRGALQDTGPDSPPPFRTHPPTRQERQP